MRRISYIGFLMSGEVFEFFEYILYTVMEPGNLFYEGYEVSEDRMDLVSVTVFRVTGKSQSKNHSIIQKYSLQIFQ